VGYCLLLTAHEHDRPRALNLLPADQAFDKEAAIGSRIKATVRSKPRRTSLKTAVDDVQRGCETVICVLLALYFLPDRSSYYCHLIR
jgi:hypothetical protein